MTAQRFFGSSAAFCITIASPNMPRSSRRGTATSGPRMALRGLQHSWTVFCSSQVFSAVAEVALDPCAQFRIDRLGPPKQAGLRIVLNVIARIEAQFGQPLTAAQIS